MSVTESPTVATATIGERAGWRDPFTWVVAGLLALPLVVSALQAIIAGERAAWDWALLELRIRDVGGDNTPLLGPYSRYGWNHPGPLMFWMLAPLYRALGADSGAMYGASALLNLVALLGVVLVARRLGGRRLLGVVAIAITLFTASAGAILADPWNPFLTLLPFALFVLAAAAVASGDFLITPVLVAAGSFVVQSHIGYAVFIVLIAVWALVAGSVVAWRRWNPGRRLSSAQRWAAIGISAGVLLVAWAVPLAEQVTNQPGNVTEIIDYFSTTTDEPIGLTESLRVAGLELAPVAPWLGGNEPIERTVLVTSTSAWWAMPAVLLLFGALWVSWRRRDVATGALTATAAVAVVAGVVAMSRITGPTYFYLVRPWWVVAMIVWVAIGWVAIRRIPLRNSTVVPPAMAGLALGLVISVLGVGSILNSVEMAAGPGPDPNRTAIETMADSILAGLQPGATYAVMPAGQSRGEALDAVVNLLEGSGYPAFTHPFFDTEFGVWRVFGGPGVPDDFAGTVVVATSESFFDGGRPGGLILLASFDPLTAAERAELESLVAEVKSSLAARGRNDLTGFISALDIADTLAEAGVDRATLGRIVALEEKGIRVAVYLDPRPVTTAGLLAPGGV